MTLAGLSAAAAAAATVAPVEAVAAALGLLYVLLVIGQRRACWLAAFASTALYLYVFYGARLYMQAALQAYYLGVAVYGWRAWRGGADERALPVTHASWRAQALALVAVAVASGATASLLADESASAQPLLDSLTTWASVYTTWLVARKKIENWPWWLAVDTLIVVLCWRQQLFASMILYVLYLGLVVVGWRRWHLDMRRQAGGHP